MFRDSVSVRERRYRLIFFRDEVRETAAIIIQDCRCLPCQHIQWLDLGSIFALKLQHCTTHNTRSTTHTYWGPRHYLVFRPAVNDYYPADKPARIRPNHSLGVSSFVLLSPTACSRQSTFYPSPTQGGGERLCSSGPSSSTPTWIELWNRVTASVERCCQTALPAPPPPPPLLRPHPQPPARVSRALSHLCCLLARSVDQLILLAWMISLLLRGNDLSQSWQLFLSLASDGCNLKS